MRNNRITTCTMLLRYYIIILLYIISAAHSAWYGSVHALARVNMG